MSKTNKVVLILVSVLIVISVSGYVVLVTIKPPEDLPSAESTPETPYILSEQAADLTEERQLELAESEPDEVDMPAAADIDAEQLIVDVFVDNIATKAPVDGNIYTVQHFEADAEMELFSESPVASLYLVWNELPGSFTISVNGNEYTFNGSEYLHQFIELPEPGEKIYLITPKHRTELCELYAFSSGRVPGWVQQWRSLEDGEYADIMLFPTHADDEYLFFGGIIPYYAGELDLNVQVVYMTEHTGTDWMRNHELLNGLWAGGDRIYPVINHQRDLLFESVATAARYYGRNIFEAFQVEQIRRYKPLVIVSHDFNGEYGHNVHKLNAECLADAVELAEDSSVFKESAEKYGVWETPKLYVHLYGENQISLNFDIPLDSFEGLTAYEAAEQAYGEYVSQHQWFSSVFGSSTAYDCHLFGLFRSTVGNDTGFDLMENTSR